MAPQTRSRGQASSSSKTYRSGPPAPQQKLFPSRSKKVKTYGRASLPARSLRQSTITQLDYLVPIEPGELELSLEEESEDDYQRAKKRRKTMGDAPSSSFHTQTLTQFVSTHGAGLEEEEQEEGDTERDGSLDGKEIREVPPVEEAKLDEVEIKGVRYIDNSDDDDGDVEISGRGRALSARANASLDSPRHSSVIPQTPSNQRIVAEIPSSQPSPFTPMLGRYSPALSRSPLKERSTNVGASPTAVQTSTKRPRTLVIADSYSTTHSSHGSDPTSPLQRTPVKQATELEPLLEESVILGEEEPLAHKVSQVPPSTASENSTPDKHYAEIADSDDELASTASTPRKGLVLTTLDTNASKHDRTVGKSPQRLTSTSNSHAIGVDEGGALPENSPERPKEGDRPMLAFLNDTAQAVSTNDIIQPESPTLTTKKSRESPARPSANSVADADTETPPQPMSSPSRAAARSTQPYSQYFTQGYESQRISLDIIRDMGPLTDRSDIMVSIHPEPMELILSRAVTQEIRNYKFPVLRIWIYVTQPVSELRYMAVVGPPTQLGARSNFAHEYQQIYELNNPVSLQRMRGEGWISNPPQKYCWIPPAVVGQLMSNLRCALLDDDDDEDDDDEKGGTQGSKSANNLTVSQEVDRQIRSDFVRSTQIRSDEVHEEISASSQGPSPGSLRSATSTRTVDTVFKRPSLPAQPGTGRPGQGEVRSQEGAERGRRSQLSRPSQATTASQPSSQVLSPERSVPRPMLYSTIPAFPEYDEDESPVGIPAAFSLVSSQDIQPDSVVVNEVVRRPPEIWDSEDEEDVA